MTQRMKCAGMRWNIKGGQGVLTARSLIQSDLFDNGWDVLAKTYIEKIKLPENVIPFRKNKRIMMLTVTNRSTPIGRNSLAHIKPHKKYHIIQVDAA